MICARQLWLQNHQGFASMPSRTTTHQNYTVSISLCTAAAINIIFVAAAAAAARGSCSTCTGGIYGQTVLEKFNRQ